MRSYPERMFHLSFLLPKGVELRPGDAIFAAPACTFRIVHPLVKIIGPSREAAFAMATALLRTIVPVPKPFAIAATIVTPCCAGGGRDSWSIIVGADIAFSPTRIDPWFPTDAALRLRSGIQSA